MTSKRKQITRLAILLLAFAEITPVSVLAGPPPQAGQAPLQRMVRSPQDAQAMIDRIPGVKFKKNLPDNFPVPKYPTNVTSTSFNYSTRGLPAASANLITSDSKQKVFDWYQQNLRSAGWEVSIASDESLGKNHDRISMLKGIRSKEEATVMCVTLKQKPGTSIDIGWTKTK